VPTLPSFQDASRPDVERQSASFQIGSLLLELSASPGAARLVITADTTRCAHVIDPADLAAWAVSTARLFTLSAAPTADGRAEFRSPYLLDREGTATIAFEALVSENGVGHRLLVTRGPNSITGIMTTTDMARGVAEAAAGAAAVAARTG
jgi:hypothetical protein